MALCTVCNQRQGYETLGGVCLDCRQGGKQPQPSTETDQLWSIMIIMAAITVFFALASPISLYAKVVCIFLLLLLFVRWKIPKYWKGIFAIGLILFDIIIYLGSYGMLDGFAHWSSGILFPIAFFSSLALAIFAMRGTNEFDKDVGNMLVPIQLLALVFILIAVISQLGP